jgi:hypothetical protein
MTNLQNSLISNPQSQSTLTNKQRKQGTPTRKSQHPLPPHPLDILVHRLSPPSTHHAANSSNTKMCHIQTLTLSCPTCHAPIPDTTADYRVCDSTSPFKSCVAEDEEPVYRKPGAETMDGIEECEDCRKIRVRVKRFVEEMRRKMRRKRGKSVKAEANQGGKASKEGDGNGSSNDGGNSYVANGHGGTEASNKDSPLKSLPDIWKCNSEGSQAHECELPLDSLPEIWKCDSDSSRSHKSIR